MSETLQRLFRIPYQIVHTMIKAIGVALSVLAAGGMLKEKPIDNQHFLIHGQVFELDPLENREHDAANTRVIVYEKGEIYVAFKTAEDGKYLFNLPVGRQYTLEYGGDDYVNKVVTIDASKLGEQKKPEILEMDMGLFRHFEGVDYTFLDAPVAKFRYMRDEGFEANAGHAIRMSEKTAKCMDSIRSLNVR